MSFDRAAIEALRNEWQDQVEVYKSNGEVVPAAIKRTFVGVSTCLDEIDRLTQRDCQNKVLEDSTVKAVKRLDSACTYYCEWYATGRASDAGHVAYDLVSRIREALHILRLAETEGR